MSFTDSNVSEQKYDIYMATTLAGTYSIIKNIYTDTSKTGTIYSYTKTGLLKGKTYYFKAIAVSQKGKVGPFTPVKSGLVL